MTSRSRPLDLSSESAPDQLWARFLSDVESCERAWGAVDAGARLTLEREWSALDLRGATRVAPIDQLLWVALIGGTNVGKSAVFNALCGAEPGEELSPTLVTAGATKHPLVRLPLAALPDSWGGSADGAHEVAEPIASPVGSLTRLERPNQLTQPLVQPLARPLTSSSHPLIYASPYARRDAPRLREVGSERQERQERQERGGAGRDHPLRDLALVDCPDHDSDRVENAESAAWVATRVDVCVYVTTPSKYRSLSAIEVIVDLLKRGREVWVLLNKVEASLLEGDDPPVNEIWRDLMREVTARADGRSFRALGALRLAESRAELNALSSDLWSAFQPLLTRSPSERKSARRLQRLKPQLARMRRAIELIYTARQAALDELKGELERRLSGALSTGQRAELEELITARAELEARASLASALNQSLYTLISARASLLEAHAERYATRYHALTLTLTRAVAPALGVTSGADLAHTGSAQEAACELRAIDERLDTWSGSLLSDDLDAVTAQWAQGGQPSDREWRRAVGGGLSRHALEPEPARGGARALPHARVKGGGRVSAVICGGAAATFIGWLLINTLGGSSGVTSAMVWITALIISAAVWLITADLMWLISALKRSEREGSLTRAVDVEAELNDRARAHRARAQQTAQALKRALSRESSQDLSQDLSQALNPELELEGSAHASLAAQQTSLTQLMSALDSTLKLTEGER